MGVEKLLNITEDALPRISSLILGIFVLLGVIIASNDFIHQVALYIQFPVRPFLYPILITSWVFYWVYFKYGLPRTNKGKVGIVIALYSETESDRKRLKADFISKLKKDMRQEGILKFTEVLFLKNHISLEINNSIDPKSKIKEINKNVQAHFYVWGDVKKRQAGAMGERYHLNLQGYVVHKPIPQNLSNEIAKDFSKVLPSEVNFLENRSFEGFEASATIVHLAAKYIIGLAAFVSHDPEMAFKLHSGLTDQFNSRRPLTPELQNVLDHIPALLSDELLWMAKLKFQKNEYPETKRLLNMSLDLNRISYAAWVFKAVLDFLLDSNVDEAFESIRKAERFAKYNYEWRYSKAFLYFWKEDYHKAMKLCRAIKNQSYPSEPYTLDEVREFNLRLLSGESPRIQLYFWIGYLSLFKRLNLGEALQDFENYERLSTPEMGYLTQKSSAYIREIKQKMRIVS